jgi:hypothetical protein
MNECLKNTYEVLNKNMECKTTWRVEPVEKKKNV